MAFFLILMLVYPLGAAGQNIGVCLSLVYSFYFLFKRDFLDLALQALRDYKWPLGFALAFIIWVVVANISNSENPAPIFAEPLGLLPWLLLPFFALCLAQFSPPKVDKLLRFMLLLITIWGVIAFSQYIWGWRIHGVEVISDIRRPRGLYSHPLTLAYAALIPWSLISHLLVEQPKKLLHWSGFMALAVILYTTHSRTIQGVALLIFLCILFRALKQTRLKVLALSVIAIVSVLVFTTDNAINQRVRATFSSEGVDKQQDTYPDDRIAFWHAHLEMIKERPILGHGTHLGRKYREKYYRRIGLEAFSKQYEAHNTYIQILAESGIVGLLLWLAWMCWHLRQAWIWERERTPVLSLSLFGFLLAGLTQNSFQDSEVRLGLTLLCSAVWIMCHVRPSQPRD